ncbi:hypothetical protein I6J77_11855 [Rhodanobacter sp. FDAARGOS 1247]|uniref:hypothetical protein n=1 Tax=Rhodanobacter sp. FDAARGOS 1247 TaxID=2778082 RepID=UPI0019522438|nr:hypothetical protein [Rhodanobacter sp. FDAARGOS 1247]QRP62825.1 hypothetical protein I6J77_11855 [Rhodanobacter sp. FDAARGOS 1247]
MSQLTSSIAFLLIGIGSAQAAPGSCATRAATMLDALGRNDYAAAGREMGPQLQGPQQQKMLISMWEALIKNNWGPYRSHGEATTLVDDGTVTRIRLPLQFDHGSTTATISCHAKDGGAIGEFVLL